MSKKDKKISTTLNYIKHLLILALAINGYISFSAIAYLLGIPTAIMSSAIGSQIRKRKVKEDL